ncbi:hypothetical protein MMC13_007458 [Lambiella insularis]|nr:hypothetical protein [Lambiella insularis]
MALAPKFAGQALSFGSSPHATHTLELYLDYVCPVSKAQLSIATWNLTSLIRSFRQFSGKMFNTLHTSVFPLVKEKYSAKVRFILRQQIQPWHPSSTLVHEAGAAVLRLSPAKFFEFSAALFEHQKEYFDLNVVNESRNETYKRLAKLAGTAGVDEAKVMDLLKVTDKPAEDGLLNVGNEVTNDVKLMVKVRNDR